MGSGSSTHEKPQQTDSGCNINVNFLFEALNKLALVFEVNESLTISLCDEILDSNHPDRDSQYRGVEEWVKKYGDCELTPQEIFHLIKYVELYVPVAPMVSIDADSPLEAQLSGDSEDVFLPLMCPYQGGVDFATWAAAIRSEEHKKTLPSKENETLRFESFEYTVENEGFRTLRGRAHSDMSEEYCV